MELTNLILGVILLAAFGWILMRNSNRSGFINALFRVDTLLGMIGGLYLVITSVVALLI